MDSSANDKGRDTTNSNLQLFVVSLVMLFLEIFLIRWISTEVRIFAYVGNLVLLACFLGIGVGAFYAGRRHNILVTFGMLVLIAVSVRSMPFRYITDMLGGFADSPVWFGMTGGGAAMVFEGIALTVCMFCMIVVTFIPLGQILGRLLDDHRSLIFAYSLNVGASVLGIWAFHACSLLYTEPWIWFALALACLLMFLPAGQNARYIAWACSVLILLVTGVQEQNAIEVWSPYQKLSVQPSSLGSVPNGYVVNVNNVGYMSLTDFSPEFQDAYPGLYDPVMLKYNQYVVPYQFKDDVQSVLIVGAGGGNDAAGALRSGVPDVDAVEIDPGIYRIGRTLHPEKPYDDQRVHVTIDDARAYFKKCRKKYDLIIFGLLDSHTLSSNYNNMRLDHYIYTEESLRDAKRLLKQDGVISLSFAAERRWIGDRLYGMLQRVFGEVPFVFYTSTWSDRFNWGTTLFVTGNNPAQLKALVAAKPGLQKYINAKTITCEGNVRPTSDDWPYLYIERPSIPRLYLCVLGALLVLIVLGAKSLQPGACGGINLHFFFLGAAFLLLEFQNVSKSSLLFGSTWIVNAYMISAILILILLANLYVSRIKIASVVPYYVLLLLSVLGVYLVPLDLFNAFDYWTKSLLASAFMNLPIFFAGIIFIHSFSSVADKKIAFGSNLLGSAVGGLLEPLSFIVGIKALLLLVLLLYVCSFFGRPKGCSQP